MAQHSQPPAVVQAEAFLVQAQAALNQTKRNAHSHSIEKWLFLCLHVASLS
jgi:hypothetical protein